MTVHGKPDILSLLSRAHQQVHSLVRQACDGRGITPAQFVVLAQLSVGDGLRQVELSEKLHLDRATMVGLIDRLARKKLVERLPHPEDRRAHLIVLTPRGREEEIALSEAVRRVHQRISSRLLPGGEYHALSLLLRELAER